MLANVILPLLFHMAPAWLWSSHVRQERLVTATAAIQQARKYQATLRTQGQCVSDLRGWNADPQLGPGVLISQVQVTGKRLMIECDQKQRRFSVSISFPRDDFGAVEGTFDGPLSISYWRATKLETRVIPEDADIEAFAKLLAFGE